jgi:hypothetical protein
MTTVSVRAQLEEQNSCKIYHKELIWVIVGTGSKGLELMGQVVRKESHEDAYFLLLSVIVTEYHRWGNL